jgi:hypothetical protein
MSKHISWAAVVSFVILSAQAQAPATTPPPGPTMEETVAFINQVFTDRGPIAAESGFYKEQGLKLQGGCALEYTQVSILPTDGKTSGDPTLNRNREKRARFLIHLDSSKVPNFSVKKVADNYFIVGNIDYKQLSYETNDQKPMPVHFGDDLKFRGSIRSISGETMTVVTEEGKLISVELRNRYRYQTEVNISYAGTISSLAPDEFVDTDVHFKDTFWSSGRFVQNIKVSDHIDSPTFGPFPSEDAATRAAKAFIHSMVLCHNDSKPSLF